MSALSYCSRPYVADPKKHDDDDDDDGDEGDDDDDDDDGDEDDGSGPKEAAVEATEVNQVEHKTLHQQQ